MKVELDDELSCRCVKVQKTSNNNRNDRAESENNIATSGQLIGRRTFKWRFRKTKMG